MKCELCGGKKNLMVVCGVCLGESKGLTALFALSVPDYRSSYVRKARRSTGMSQRKFAASIGVSPVTVARWETGNVVPSEDKIQSLLAFTEQVPKGGTHEE